MASATDTLGDHAKHLFIFTSAGKPIFSRYDSDTPNVSALYGLLLVLMQSAALAPRKADGVGCPPRESRLRRMEASLPVSAATAGGPFAKVVFYFEQRDNVLYAMAVRTRGMETQQLRKRKEEAGTSPLGEASPPPPCPPIMDDEAVCRAQLNFSHLLLLSVAPTLAEALARDPGYDASHLFSPADFALLRTALDAFEASPSLCTGAVPVLPVWGRAAKGMPTFASPYSLAASLARLSEAGVETDALLHFMDSLLWTHCTTTGPAAAAHDAQGRRSGASGAPKAEENVIFACLAHTPAAHAREQGACDAVPTLLTCVDRSVPLFQTPVPTSDILLLLVFAQGVLRRQAGEAWAPIALPGFNNSGYVWCHCCLVEQGEEGRGGGGGGSALMLVQVSVSEHDFPPLSQAAQRVASGLAHVRLQAFFVSSDKLILSVQHKRQQQLIRGRSVLSLFDAPTAQQQQQHQQQQQQHQQRWARVLAASATSHVATPRDGARDAPQAPSPPTPSPSFFTFFARKEERHRQRRAVLHRNATNALDTLQGFLAVYKSRLVAANGASGAGGHPVLLMPQHLHERTDAWGNERSGLASTQHVKRCVAGGNAHHRSAELDTCFTSLLMEARRRRQRTHGAQSPFTVFQSDEACPRRPCRVLLLNQPDSAFLLTQMCQFCYRNPDALTEADKKAIASLSTSPESEAAARAVLTAPRPYQFSQLLEAVRQSMLQELCVVVDADATMEESWYCVMLVLHSLVLL